MRLRSTIIGNIILVIGIVALIGCGSSSSKPKGPTPNNKKDTEQPNAGGGSQYQPGDYDASGATNPGSTSSAAQPTASTNINGQLKDTVSSIADQAKATAAQIPGAAQYVNAVDVNGIASGAVDAAQGGNAAQAAGQITQGVLNTAGGLMDQFDKTKGWGGFVSGMGGLINTITQAATQGQGN